jgi:tripeptide aminopeptidase
MTGSSSRATLWLIARDHDDAKLEAHVDLVRRVAEEVVGREPRASFHLDVQEQYRNMRTELDRHPQVVEAALEAIRRAGVEPVHTIVRGGTDGARLTEKGLPTPNIFTGGQHYHSLREWASVQDMGAAAATAVELIRLWGEPGRLRRPG